MKKYVKNFSSKRMTVEAMATCAEKCITKCNCSSMCGSDIQTGAAIANSPGVYNLTAIGSAVSP